MDGALGLPELEGKSVLITGGTGSFGNALVARLLRECAVDRLIVYSRDELKQSEMAQRFPEARHPEMRYFIGDVRDLGRLRRAFDGVDVVIHAAAMKQVPASEYNPSEAISTNITGAMNIVDAAIDRGVEKVVALSTDKAANPINLYGATKLCSDKLFVAGNHYAGRSQTRFSVVRYGNVMASRGSVIPFFRRQRAAGRIPITHPEMTRFNITLEEGVTFVLESLEMMHGGEIFVPKIPSYRIEDLAEAVAPGCPRDVIGIRPGEKLHEVMVPQEVARHTMDVGDRFVILPESLPRCVDAYTGKGRLCPEGFSYQSDSNTDFLTVEQIRALVAELGVE